MGTKTNRVALTARAVAAVAAAVFAASTLSGCDVLFPQLHQVIPGDHSGHNH
ncbi:hypothetical protein [Mycobacterium spongiae]|uniref:Lipoprotein n=1 Tax=Mycobacterium spongiae TaxID=886343 RepID=A0A975JY77_9MYCO|nr:hypothetical protein [Mycobacterium spongiae]QUR67911.1 hypothetical protein F6B93_13075 [Mycobacterium spongiae]